MKSPSQFPFSPLNYKIMIAGIVILLIGFLIIASDSEAHGFGFLGLTLGPMTVLLGFAVEIVAIMYSGEKNN